MITDLFKVVNGVIQDSISDKIPVLAGRRTVIPVIQKKNNL